jgi:hypothetical protein
MNDNSSKIKTGGKVGKGNTNYFVSRLLVLPFILFSFMLFLPIFSQILVMPLKKKLLR